MKIELSKITIENPSESIDPEQLQGIVSSFKEIGQSHQIIVRLANITYGDYILVSGEKRLLAAKELGWEAIDAEVRPISSDEGRIIRLHENLRRHNLPWWEQVILVEQLHSLRQQEHGAATRGRPEVGVPKVGWSIKDTAKELSIGMGNLSEDLHLARALRQDPTLSKVKDKKTAVRLVRLAIQRHDTEIEAASPRKDDSLENEVLFGDSSVILAKLPANSVDHCITDPPWIRFFDPALTLDDRTLPVFKELYRVLKHNALVYIFCGLDDYDYYAGHLEPNPDDPSGDKKVVAGQLQKLGFSVATTPIIWQKLNSLSRRGVRPWEYERDFEFIIVAAKGNPTLVSSRQLSGIKSFKIVHPSSMIHPNEKPAELIEDLLTDCSYEGNLIIDPFAGSGVLGPACLKNKRKYVLIERDKTAYDKIMRRLEK